ncbi:E3 SUMO-protein ligase ZBED1-like [Styela clava]
MRPVSIVEGAEFQNLMSVMEPNFHTSVQKIRILGVEPVHKRHTADNIVEWICGTVEQYSIENKVTALVSDNGSNMLKARKILETDKNWKSVSYAAHTLQLCLNSGFSIPALDHAFASARRLVNHFKRSHMATEALKTKCQMMEIEDLKLIVDVATRWGSTFEMLNRLVKLHCPISLVLNGRNIISQASTLSMRASDWEIIKAILPVVEPFDQVVQSLGGQDYAPISTKVPSIRGLIKKLEVVETDASPIEQFKEKLCWKSLADLQKPGMIFLLLVRF